MSVQLTILLAALISMDVQPQRNTPLGGKGLPEQLRPAGTAAPVGPIPKLADASLEPGEGKTVALKLADQLISSFVYRNQAEAYAAMLRRNAGSGRYDSGTRGQIAKLLTDDLQAVHKDGHLHVMVVEPEQPAAAANGEPEVHLPPIQSAKTIAPGIGYIRFSAFVGDPAEIAGVRRWLAENRNAKTLIFDLRNHHGGGLDEQDVIFSYLYGRKTPLVKMAIARESYEKRRPPPKPRPTLFFTRVGETFVATHSALPGPITPLRKAKVYLLVSNETGSAAEHFSLALKSTKRATLIGEATAGANHFGGPLAINEHFEVWMPMGRTYDIKTGKDWEGAGIAPDIKAAPKYALVLALQKAGLSRAEAIRLDAQEVPAEPVHADKLQAR